MRHLSSQRFGRLVAVCPTKKRAKSKHIIWLCRCDCGNLKEIVSNSLLMGLTKSCGCLQRETRANFKHGEAVHGKRSRLCTIWYGIKKRCSNPNEPSYKYYGGKGISICKEWKNSYVTFRDWALANGYQDNLVIDRIDNDKGYSPNNCQWITRSENSKKSQRERRKK